MASKSKRSTRTRESIIRVESSTDDSSINGSTRSQSPNSLHIGTRQDEKKYLSMLNDRLATYIETVRKLEAENSQLQIQVRELHTVERKEKQKLENLYSKKIEDLRIQIEALTRDKAKNQVEVDKSKSERDEYKAQAFKLEKDFKKCDADRKKFHTESQDLSASYIKADTLRKEVEKENDELKRHVTRINNQLDLAQRQLEDEVVLRTEIENRLKAAKDDLDLARKSHQNQLEEVTLKRQYEMTTVSKEIETQYQSKFQEQLQEMRINFANQLSQNRADFEFKCQKKLDEARENEKYIRDSSAKAREENSTLRSHINQLEKSEKESNEQIERLTIRIHELENKIRELREYNDFGLKQRDEQISQLQREISEMIKENQDLLDIKVQLDAELQAYQKLLEGEESRLHITPTQSPNTSMNTSSQGLHVSFADSVGEQLVTTSSSRRGIKRKRLNEEYVSFDNATKSYKTRSHSDNDLVIDDADPEGKYVKLKNTGANDYSIATWSLKYVNGEREVFYKFNSRQTVKSGDTITVWSKNAAKEDKATSNLVMKNQAWPVGDGTRIELLNPEEQIVAWRESALESSNQYHESGDKNCSIM